MTEEQKEKEKTEKWNNEWKAKWKSEGSETNSVVLCVAVGVINGLFEAFRTKGGWQKERETETYSMSLDLWPQERNIATPVEEKLHRPTGGLTYCISAS